MAPSVVGVDFGTLSGRAVVVRASDGEELGRAVHEYAHGVMAARSPSWALQDPEDYLDVLRDAVPAAVRAAGIAPEQVVGIATDFTASTPLPVLRDGTPLCREFPRPAARLSRSCGSTTPPSARPTAINALAAERGEPWLARYGGRISSEWEFAKALQVLEEDPEIYERTERWIEAADWIVWQLCGRETRNVCTAGYKGDLPGRPLPVAGVPARARTSASPTSSPTSSRASRSPARRLRGATHRAGRRVDRAARGDRGRGRQRGRARHRARRRRRRAGPDAGGHGHLHVPRHERRPSWPRCRACAASSTAGSCPACGATRRARAASATSSAGSSTTLPRAARTNELDARLGAPRSRPSARTG